jgi:signal transduction histidine kinase
VKVNDLDRLAALIRAHTDSLLDRWRAEVRALPSAQHLDTPTLNDHIPQLLRELADALASHADESIPEALSEGSPPEHGRQRVDDGFDITEVVAEYNILRGCIHDLADANGLRLQGEPFHIVNRVLDGAIGLAVRTFASSRERDLKERREQYLAFVAHDLRTPLNAISLVTSVLESAHGGETSDATAPMLRILRRNVRELVGLVDLVLEENTGEPTENGVVLFRRDLDLWPLTEALLQAMHPVAADAGAQLVNEVPQQLVVHADASLLHRILQNLVSNAVRYTAGGVVSIGAREVGADGTVECVVRDNGQGIPPLLLEKVFEKGESSQETDGSTGLGLAIVKSFVEAHGGTVDVESREGEGTMFRFTLPGRDAAPSTGR